MQYASKQKYRLSPFLLSVAHTVADWNKQHVCKIQVKMLGFGLLNFKNIA